MASYIDYLSAKIDDEDRAEIIEDIRNDQIDEMLTILHGMQDYVIMVCNYRQTGILTAEDLRSVIVKLYSLTDSFVDIRVCCYIVVQCLDNVELIYQQVQQVVSELCAEGVKLPRKVRH
jgi:hypothetical protein